jgi:hypothetical protein
MLCQTRGHAICLVCDRMWVSNKPAAAVLGSLVFGSWISACAPENDAVSSKDRPDRSSVGAVGGDGTSEPTGAAGQTTPASFDAGDALPSHHASRVLDTTTIPVDAASTTPEAGAIPAEASHQDPLGFSCFGGQSARDVLGHLKAHYASTISGGDARATVTIDDAYAGGVVHCEKGLCPCDPIPGFPCGECKAPGVPSVDVALTFRTSDGTFDEQLTATVRLSDEVIVWSAELPMSELRGTYHFHLDPSTSPRLLFQGQMSDKQASGVVSETNHSFSGYGISWGY